MTPNRFDVVDAEFTRHPPAPNSQDSCGEFTRRVAWALNAAGDPNGWGLLKKGGGTNYKGYAVDAIIYGPTQQVIDIIANSGSSNPQPAWQEVGKRDSDTWAPPIKPDDPVDDSDSALKDAIARILALEKTVTALQHDVAGAVLLLTTTIDDLASEIRARLVALETKPLPDDVARAGWPVRVPLKFASVLNGTVEKPR